MSFSLSPVFEDNTFVCDLHDETWIDEVLHVFGKKFHLRRPMQVKEIKASFGTMKVMLPSPPRIHLLDRIPQTITPFPKFNRKQFIADFCIPPKYTYTSVDKHATLLIKGEKPFNPSKFQRLEKTKIPYFRGSCSFWCLWYIEYTLANKQYSREFLEKYALYRLRKHASEYLSWWIASTLRLHGTSFFEFEV